MNSIDKKWRKSAEYLDAVSTFILRTGSKDEEEFRQSDEFRNARHRYRKKVNDSWDREAC